MAANGTFESFALQLKHMVEDSDKESRLIFAEYTMMLLCNALKTNESIQTLSKTCETTADNDTLPDNLKYLKYMVWVILESYAEHEIENKLRAGLGAFQHRFQPCPQSQLLPGLDFSEVLTCQALHYFADNYKLEKYYNQFDEETGTDFEERRIRYADALLNGYCLTPGDIISRPIFGRVYHVGVCIWVCVWVCFTLSI